MNTNAIINYVVLTGIVFTNVITNWSPSLRPIYNRDLIVFGQWGYVQTQTILRVEWQGSITNVVLSATPPVVVYKGDVR